MLTTLLLAAALAGQSVPEPPGGMSAGTYAAMALFALLGSGGAVVSWVNARAAFRAKQQETKAAADAAAAVQTAGAVKFFQDQIIKLEARLDAQAVAAVAERAALRAEYDTDRAALRAELDDLRKKLEESRASRHQIANEAQKLHLQNVIQQQQMDAMKVEITRLTAEVARLRGEAPPAPPPLAGG